MNFRERERIKRLRQRWVARFQKRAPFEQHLILEALSGQPTATDPHHLEQEAALHRWLARFPPRLEMSIDAPGLPDETREQRMARLFKAINYDLSLLIDEFGYEAVYFGVGCEVFPDAVDPWQGNNH